jgi:hypothetical protein
MFAINNVQYCRHKKLFSVGRKSLSCKVMWKLPSFAFLNQSTKWIKCQNSSSPPTWCGITGKVAEHILSQKWSRKFPEKMYNFKLWNSIYICTHPVLKVGVYCSKYKWGHWSIFLKSNNAISRAWPELKLRFFPWLLHLNTKQLQVGLPDLTSSLFLYDVHLRRWPMNDI